VLHARGTGSSGRCHRAGGVEVFRWIGAEPFQAALGAEVIRLALELEMTSGVGGVDRHPADRVKHFAGRYLDVS
jgi:hypothetical protein